MWLLGTLPHRAYRIFTLQCLCQLGTCRCKQLRKRKTKGNENNVCTLPVCHEFVERKNNKMYQMETNFACYFSAIFMRHIAEGRPSRKLKLNEKKQKIMKKHPTLLFLVPYILWVSS